jgi:hypothetical protein
MDGMEGIVLLAINFVASGHCRRRAGHLLMDEKRRFTVTGR